MTKKSFYIALALLFLFLAGCVLIGLSMYN